MRGSFWDNQTLNKFDYPILEDSVNVFQIDSDGNESQKTIKLDSETIKGMVRQFYDRVV